MDFKKFYTGETATLKIDGKEIELPIVVGTEGEKGIDISQLRKLTGCVTIDPSFVNTASCFSSITYIDGEKGILRYRGIPVEELIKNASFIRTAYLLIHGYLPDEEKSKKFSALLNRHSLLHEDMRHFFDRFPSGAHPMHILSTMINALKGLPCETA